MKKIIIEEGSKVNFRVHGTGSDDVIMTFEANTDIEVTPNAIIMIDGGLFCTDSSVPVEKVFDSYIVNVWLQDAYCAKDNRFYKSLNDAN